MEEKDLINKLKEIKEKEDVSAIKKELQSFVEAINNIKEDVIGYEYDDKALTINKTTLCIYLNNMLEQSSKERVDFYYDRLIKALTEVKTSKYNDINLNRWKEYDDILTDSLWIIDQRDKNASHSGDYWGNFVPQIPNQLLKRYTKAGEWVLDPFLGSGTTLIEAALLGRNGIGIELQEHVAKIAKERVEAIQPTETKSEIVLENSQAIELDKVLKQLNIKKVQFVLMHPPYWDIIQFSKHKSDLSNNETLDDFLDAFGQVIDNTTQYLEKGRFAAVVIGDKYEKGEWIPLGFYTMQEFLKRGFKLKSIIVKNFDETKGKRNQRNLWKYRALSGGFYLFKHEYIYVFQKK
ncbi:DNA methyltransferase [Natranaerovirga hydrolytica]|uniref:DNA methyltransferase n=1 Tax=Natranaerovirga hydrolytica TaxID=680378 RepID=UPI001A9B6DEE|nr:DNA methyltransferase [Natranaerovirga hydrolytica]